MAPGRAKNRNITAAISIAAVAAASAFAYYIYKAISEPSTSASSSRSTSYKSPRSSDHSSSPRNISLVVSKTLLEQGLPLQTLLANNPKLVVILAPSVSRFNLRQLNSQIPEQEEYKVIPCETDIGVVHVLKHLKSDIVLLPHDIPQTVPIDIDRYVGTVVVLEKDQDKSSELIREVFF